MSHAPRFSLPLASPPVPTVLPPLHRKGVGREAGVSSVGPGQEVTGRELVWPVTGLQPLPHLLKFLDSPVFGSIAKPTRDILHSITGEKKTTIHSATILRHRLYIIQYTRLNSKRQYTERRFAQNTKQIPPYAKCHTYGRRSKSPLADLRRLPV